LEEKEYTVEYILENELDKKAYGFIYITTNLINGKKYIGLKTFDKRWKYYLGSGIIFKKSLSLYGKENFKRNILTIAFSKEELDKLEIEFIKKYNAVENDNYYNLQYGGHNGKHSKESKIKISKNHYNVNGQNNPMYGKKQSLNTKQKISQANTGKLLGEKSPLYGKKLSDERKKQIGAFHKGKIISEETKRKMSESTKGENSPWYGKHPSEETKRKISMARKIEIVQLSLKGEYIKEWDSVMDAEKSLNITNISNCCTGKQKMAGGLHWMYYDDYIKQQNESA